MEERTNLEKFLLMRVEALQKEVNRLNTLLEQDKINQIEVIL